MIDFKSFPKIDAHIHFNTGREALLRLAAEYNFSLLSINTEVPEFPSIDEQNALARKYSDVSGTRLYHATTVSTQHVFDEGWADRAIQKIKRNVARGAVGVKFWKNIGMTIQRDDGRFLQIDDPVFNPVFVFLAAQDIPVLGHQGGPKNCWLPVEEMTVKSDRDYFAAHPEYHMYKHEEYPDYWDHIKARDRVLKKHPQLKFVGLHMASLEWSLDEIAARLDTFPNFAIDLAERINHLYNHTIQNRQKVLDFFQTYQDRIIYGTDIIDDPSQDKRQTIDDLTHRWSSHWQFFATDNNLTSDQVRKPFIGLKLSEAIIKKIYRYNAAEWYQLSAFNS